MINKINNTTNKAKPPEKPQPPQLPPNPIMVPPLIRGENKGSLMHFNGFKLLYVFYAIIEQVLLKIKKRHLKVPFSDLNHLNFNNICWTPIQILFYHVKLFYSLRNKIQIYVLFFIKFGGENALA